MRTALALVLAGLTLAGAARAEDFRLYQNERFGVSAYVPKSWTSLPPPENGDGLVFISPDKQGQIIVSGMLNINDDPGPDAARVTALGEHVIYRSAGSGWVVASGDRDGRIFYRKSVLGCHGKVYGELTITYPAAQKQAYDPLVNRVAGSFRSGCGIYEGQ